MLLNKKNHRNKFRLEQKYVNLILTFIFVIFVIPHSFSVGGQGVSGNYLFVLFPLLFYIYSNELNWPKLSIFLFMSLLLCIFIVAFVYQSEYIEYSTRRIASFILFMSIFAFMFVKIDSNMIRSFKYAIVIFSIYTAITVLTRYIEWGGSELGTYAKGQVGSTRIGFIYIFALWIVYFFNSRTVLFTILKHATAIMIIIGLLLTFARSSMAALVFSVFVYLVVITLTGIKEGKSFRQLLHKIFLSVVYIIGLSILLGNLFPNTVVEYKRYSSYVIPFAVTPISTQTDTSISTQTDTPISTQTDTSVLKILEQNFKELIDVLKRANISAQTNTTPKDMESCLISCSFYERLLNKNTSLGYRVFMTNKVIDFVSQNPFTGSGFLGVWVMLDKVDGEIKGSAHGQFIDVFFRLGFIGFFVYIFFIYKILKFLYYQDSGLFIGFVGMLIYGLFHETFKLSQGAFIFAFLFAMYDQRKHCL